MYIQSVFDVEINIERQKRNKVIVKSQMNCSKMGEENFDLGSIYFVILFGIRSNSMCNGSIR
jgi:hypothetical protein